MQYTDSTFATPEQNLACDEALLEWCEANGGEVLRLWEPQEYFVVLGYSNEASVEVNLASCRDAEIPVLRRCSGGGTVLQGKGCLNYSLILNMDRSPHLKGARETNRWIMGRHQKRFQDLLGKRVEVCGFTDLTLGSLKFSGNAQRRGRNCLLFHGTFLWGMDLGCVEKYLGFPSKQPSYRRNRSHSDFLTNLKASPEGLKQALVECWNARPLVEPLPLGRIDELASSKYAQAEWNRLF